MGETGLVREGKTVEYATGVILSNNEDGVAKWLEANVTEV